MKKRAGLLGALKTANEVCKLTTGRRLDEIISAGIDLFGGDIVGKIASSGAMPDPAELARKLPYISLGISPDAPDFIVRAAYKSYMKQCHPDTNKADQEKAAKINNAYEAICKERGIPK